MNEEIDETDFYHQDFTTATEWEIFIARMEEIIHEWKMEDRACKSSELQNKSGVWALREENIQFVDVDFTLSYHTKAKVITDPQEADEIVNRKHPMDKPYDFVLYNSSKLNSECALALWYGLDEFIVLSPAGKVGITSESKIKVLLSSLHIVIGSTNLNIAVFVQIREKWQRCYLGVYEADGIRTNFEMIHLRKGPQHCQYFTGLLDLFKTKIMSPVSLDPVVVSLKMSYNLTDFGNSTWKQELPLQDNDSFDSNMLTTLPFGVTFDPISAITFNASWSHLQEYVIIDSESYSDFDPLQAPKWSLLVQMAEQPLCLLSECVTEMLHLISNHSTMYDVLGDFAAGPDNDSSNPLDVLTESRVPAISTVLKRAARNSLTKSKRDVAPLSEDVLVPMLYFLFPDADEESTCPYDEAIVHPRESLGDTSLDNSTSFTSLGRGFKTCPVGSLVWRMSIMLAHALQSLGGVRAVAHLWFEFVQEMRYRWEKSILVPGLSPGFPDPRTCLLHQKLQMLNCCIERKKIRESRDHETLATTNEESSTDDEEFFDCSPDQPNEEDAPKRKSKHSLWNRPVGRQGKFLNFKLINTGDPLYIPITQEPGPKSEDQLEEDTDVLLKLGSDAQGSELRAKMMSASLLSDMESFKAANPGSILEDFIRWYSPRDWIEIEEEDEWGQKKGYLSSRMLISDNTWLQMWESAKPVAASRQKRLFDDTREAEKVLHFLDSRTMSQITEMIFSVLFHAAISRLCEDFQLVSAEIPECASSLRRIIESAERLSRDRKLSTRRYENVIQEMAALELLVSQTNSLLYKFNPSAANADQNLSAFVGSLVMGREVEIEGKDNSDVGKRIISMFTNAQKAANMILTEQSSCENSPVRNVVFPQAAVREFVMRVDACKPSAYSCRSSQFLRAILAKNEFRLAGAFTEDIVFS